MQQTTALNVYAANDKRLRKSKHGRSATHYEPDAGRPDMKARDLPLRNRWLQHHLSAIRYTAVLIIDVATAQDIGERSKSCMRGAAAVAALAALAAVISGGSAAGLAGQSFADALKVSLRSSSRLRMLVSRYDIRRDCGADIRRDRAKGRAIPHKPRPIIVTGTIGC